MRKVLPATDRVRKWTPSLGHVYTQPTPSALSKTKEDTVSTPMPDGSASNSNGPSSKGTSNNKKDSTAAALERLAEESFAIHMRHGGDYFDENPITGRPGDFHFASTGRKDNSKIAPPPPPLTQRPQKPQKPGINIKAAEEAKKDGKGEKSPRTPSMPKPKRKKSKIATPGTTPAPSQ